MEQQCLSVLAPSSFVSLSSPAQAVREKLLSQKAQMPLIFQKIIIWMEGGKVKFMPLFSSWR